jgi:serine protease Do
MGLNVSAGALITDVPEGPARDAGLLSGDVIITFNNAEISDVRDLTRTVADSPIGEDVPVVVLRAGDEVTVPVTLGRREEAEGEVSPAAADAPDAPTAPEELEVLGMMVQPLTDEIAQTLGLAEGSTGLVIMNVDAQSDAATKGLAAGDVIAEAGQAPVTSLNDLQARITAAADEGRQSILLLIRREGNPRFVALSLQ